MTTLKRLRPDQFTVGWICAIPAELTAARVFLDESYEMLDHRPAEDPNTYFLGRIAKHNVVIAAPPHDESGISMATKVSSHLIQTFPNIRFGLMVGIGGGAPSNTNDIRLGDVVVSSATGIRGGVFQYDMGRYLEGRDFEPTTYLNRPPISLRTAVGAIRSETDLKGLDLKTRIDEAILRIYPSRRSWFQRPDPRTDILYRTDFVHNGDGSCSEVCRTSRTNIVRRDERAANDAGNPFVHYGLIASANGVMKSAHMRDDLIHKEGVLCFEMEAAGLMNTWPCIIVRGISDYSDSHINKEWQGYASLSAAAYAKALVEFIIPSQVQAEPIVTDVLGTQLLDSLNEIGALQRQLVENGQRHHAANTRRIDDEEQRKCLQSLKTCDYEGFKDLNPDRVEGTCGWVVENERYCTWLSKQHDAVLWVSADPGCGKSVLSKWLIDRRLPESICGNDIICHFFFKDSEAQNNLSKALSSILHQLFKQRQDLLSHALPIWNHSGPKFLEEVSSLWKILRMAAEDPRCPSIYCVFDALDECRLKDQQELIRLLECTCGNASPPSKLKVLLTSRPYEDIYRGFSLSRPDISLIHLSGEHESKQIRAEIDLVIQVRLDQLVETWKLSPETRTYLEGQLLSVQNRTYLWLHLVVEDLKYQFANSVQPDTCKLTRLPPSVNEAYEKLLNRVPKAREATIRWTLQIILAATYPLTVQQVADALRVLQSPGKPSRTADCLDKDLLKRRLRDHCGLMIIVVEGRLLLLHQTVKEFLTKPHDNGSIKSGWNMSRQRCGVLLGTVCIKVLLNYKSSLHEVEKRKGPLWKAICQKTGQIESEAADEDASVAAREGTGETLFDYSFLCLEDHFLFVREEDSVDWGAFVQAVTDPNHALYHAVRLSSVIREGYYSMAVHEQESIPGVHLLTLLGRIHLLDLLVLEDSSQLNAVDASGASVLQYAIQKDALFYDVNLVGWLINRGFNTDQWRDDKQYGICGPLHWALHCSDFALAEWLLQAGADVNGPTTGYSPLFVPLTRRSGGQHCELSVQILLDHGAKVSGIRFNDHSLLYHATKCLCPIGIFRILLDRGAGIENDIPDAFEEILQPFVHDSADNQPSSPALYRYSDPGVEVWDSEDLKWVGEMLLFAACNHHTEIVLAILGSRNLYSLFECNRYTEAEAPITRLIIDAGRLATENGHDVLANQIYDLAWGRFFDLDTVIISDI